MIVVSGSTGLVGAHLLFDLCQKHDKVRALKRPASNLQLVKNIFAYYSAQADTIFQKIEWVDADLNDFLSLEHAFEGATQVYHCAAMVSFHPNDQEAMVQTNVAGTANVVNAALHQQVQKLCYVSSIAAIGRAEAGQSSDEETPWKNNDNISAYSKSKYLAELEVWRGIEEGLNAVIVNPSVILGPGPWNSGSASLFPLIHRGLKFVPPGVNGYVYVRDVSRAMIQLMESNISAQRFVLSAENLNYDQLFGMMAEHLHVSKPSVPLKPWLSEISWRIVAIVAFVQRKRASYTKATARSSVKKSYYSSQKIQTALGFQFTSMQQAIEETSRLFLNDQKTKS